MSDKQTIFLIGEIQKQFAKQCIDQAPADYVCQIKQKTRTLEQNAKMWAMLSDVSRQVNWYGSKLTDEEWKHVFTASLKGQKTVPGIDGGFVVMGKSSSKMTIGEMRDVIELMYAFGAERDVLWTKDEQKPKALQQGVQIEGEFTVEEFA